MANNELRSMDIIIDSRDIDATEKKLRGLDRMLVQTQRRALALGSTRIRPSITLEDRFTETAIRLSATMKRLNQAAARPVAELIDLATPKIAEISGALQELSRTRWRVEVDVGGFGAALGSSVAERICAEGQSLMQRISVTFKEALECIFDALEVVECPAVAAGECKCGESSGSSPQESEPLCGAAGKISGEAFFEAFMEVVDPQRIAGKLANIPWDKMISDAKTAFMDFGKKIVEEVMLYIADKIQEKPSRVKELWDNSKIKKVWDSSKAKNEWLPKIKDSWDNSKAKKAWDTSKVKNEWLPKANKFLNSGKTRVMDTWDSVAGKENEWTSRTKGFLGNVKGKFGGFLDRPWVKATTGFVGKWGKYLLKKASIISNIYGLYEIFKAKPGREKAEEIGSFIGGFGGGLLGGLAGGGLLSLATAAVGGAAGSYFGEKAGGVIFDWIFGKEEEGKTALNPPNRATPDVVKNTAYGSTGSPELFQIAAPMPVPDITVNMPPGMIQIHQQQQEIDIDSISKQVGWQVTHNISRVLVNMTK